LIEVHAHHARTELSPWRVPTMMKRFGVVLVGVCVLGTASPARAQVTGTFLDLPSTEVGLGLQLLHVGGDASNTYPLGFNIDVVRNRLIAGQFGLVLEGGWVRDSTDVPGVSVSASYMNFGAGPRFEILRDPERVRPYVQILGGLSHARFSSEFDTTELDDVEESDTAFMLQPGVGFTIDGGGRWGLTGSLDYRRAFFDEGPGLGFSNTNEFRVFFGARYFIR
jgi:hypothetical protein